jgi:hypothetical protein
MTASVVRSTTQVSKHDRDEMEALLSQVDDEYSKLAVSSQPAKTSVDTADELLKTLAGLTLGSSYEGTTHSKGPLPPPIPAPVDRIQQQVVKLLVSNTLPSHLNVSTSINTDATVRRVDILITGFESKTQLNSADIQVLLLYP